MKRGMKLTAVATLVVLALTGFSTGRGHGRGHSSGGGGGCSSSSQNHGGSSSNSSTSGGSSGYGSGSGSTYDDGDDTTGGSSGGTTDRRPRHRSTPTSSASGSSTDDLVDATVRLVKCASARAPYATVEISNPNRSTARFYVSVEFQDASDVRVTSALDTVKVKGRGTTTARLKVGGEGLVSEVDHCEVDPAGTVVR